MKPEIGAETKHIEFRDGSYLRYSPWDGFETALLAFPPAIQETFYRMEESLFYRGGATAPIFVTNHIRHYPTLADGLYDFPDREGLQTTVYHQVQTRQPTVSFMTGSIAPGGRPSIYLYPNFDQRDTFKEKYQPLIDAKQLDIFLPKEDITT